MHRYHFSGVTIPRKQRVPPTMTSTFGIPNNWLMSTWPKSASLDAFVTRIPVAIEIARDGI